MITTDQLKIAIIEGLGLEDLSPQEIENDIALFGDEGLGLDSVDAIELTLIIEKEFGVKITNMAEAESIFANIDSLTEHINEHK